MPLTTTHVDDLAVLTELIDAGNDWDGVKVALATAVPALSPQMVLSDFTLATFTGATPVAVTWGTPYIDVEGNPEVDSQLLSFRCTAAPSAPETIVGYIVTDSTGAVLKWADLLPTPVPISAVGQAVAFVVGMQRYGGETTQVL